MVMVFGLVRFSDAAASPRWKRNLHRGSRLGLSMTILRRSRYRGFDRRRLRALGFRDFGEGKVLALYQQASKGSERKSARRCAVGRRQPTEGALIHEPARTRNSGVELFEERIHRADDVHPQHAAHEPVGNIQHGGDRRAVRSHGTGPEQTLSVFHDDDFHAVRVAALVFALCQKGTNSGADRV